LRGLGREKDDLLPPRGCWIGRRAWRISLKIEDFIQLESFESFVTKIV
jgi:hypothetical protein